MNKDPEAANASKRLELAIQARAQELELFWKRSLFFWGFIAAAFVGYSAALGKHPSVALLMACFGFVCSLAWTLANRGSKYWQENWEQKVGVEEQSVVGSLFAAQEPRIPKVWFSAHRFSVSRLAIALSEFTVLVWCALIGREGASAFGWTAPASHPRAVFVSMAAGTLLFSILMVFGSFAGWQQRGKQAGPSPATDRLHAPYPETDAKQQSTSSVPVLADRPGSASGSPPDISPTENRDF